CGIAPPDSKQVLTYLPSQLCETRGVARQTRQAVGSSESQLQSLKFIFRFRRVASELRQECFEETFVLSDVRGERHGFRPLSAVHGAVLFDLGRLAGTLLGDLDRADQMDRDE